MKSTHFSVLAETLFSSESSWTPKTQPNDSRACRLVEFLVFNSAFRRCSQLTRTPPAGAGTLPAFVGRVRVSYLHLAKAKFNTKNSTKWRRKASFGWVFGVQLDSPVKKCSIWCQKPCIGQTPIIQFQMVTLFRGTSYRDVSLTKCGLHKSNVSIHMDSCNIWNSVSYNANCLITNKRNVKRCYRWYPSPNF